MSTSWMNHVLEVHTWVASDTVIERLYSYHQSWIARAQITIIDNIEPPHQLLFESIEHPASINGSA